MYFEIDRATLKDEYHGGITAMIVARDGLGWTPERIRSAFSFGHGTEIDLRRYMHDNRTYSIFVEV